MHCVALRCIGLCVLHCMHCIFCCNENIKKIKYSLHHDVMVLCQLLVPEIVTDRNRRQCKWIRGIRLNPAWFAEENKSDQCSNHVFARGINNENAYRTGDIDGYLHQFLFSIPHHNKSPILVWRHACRKLSEGTQACYCIDHSGFLDAERRLIPEGSLLLPTLSSILTAHISLIAYLPR